MTELEKVIKGINCHIKKDCRENACPYACVYACEFVLLNDALELLKEQEDLGTELGNAVELIHKKNERIEKLLKEQDAEISNYKEVVENLLQQLQAINKYMTPIGMVSDVRAFIEGREQPEIIRCYACKNGEKANDVYLCGKQRGFGLAHEPNWFCADGERR